MLLFRVKQQVHIEGKGLTHGGWLASFPASPHHISGQLDAGTAEQRSGVGPNNPGMSTLGSLTSREKEQGAACYWTRTVFTP